MKGGLERGGTLRVLPVIACIALFALPRPSACAQAARNNTSSTAMTTAGPRESGSGKELFSQHCASCHFADTTAQKIGPGLKGLYGRLFSDGKKVTDASLGKWIEAGGKDMPGFKETIKPEQIRQLISYIKTL
jgi:cytochrome c